MIRPAITVLTLLEENEDLFDGLELPVRPFTDRGYDDLYLEGWDLDSDTLINNLLMETAELNVLYTDPIFMAWAITQWSKKEIHVWQAMYETLFFKYNPIWNKDGTRKHNELETRNLTGGKSVTETRDLATGSSTTSSDQGTSTTSVSDSRTTVTDEDIARDEDSSRRVSKDITGDVTETTTPATTETTTVSVSAFDSTSYQPRDQTVTGRTGTETKLTDNDVNETTSDMLLSHNDDTSRDETVTDNGSSTSTTTDGRSGSELTTGTETGSVTTTGSDTDTGTIAHDLEETEQGNIGVTTSQQMIEAERELAKFNIYDFIIESFKNRFCILVY